MSSENVGGRPADPWNYFRSQMPVAGHWAYFNHAAVAPISLPAHQAAVRWSSLASDDGGTAWAEWNQGIQACRLAAARLLGADAREVALLPNTTQGIGLVAAGLPWREGDNVVFLADEFPSNQYPWLSLAEQRVEARRLPTDHGRFELGALDALCDARTRLVAVSWIGYSTGFRCNPAAVAEIAHRHGALFFLDAIQGLGAFPLEVHAAEVDFLAADGHKWMLGPEGAGIFYVRHDLLETLRTANLGWNSVVHDQDFTKIELNLKPAAERFEGGTLNTCGFLALSASLNLLLELGIERIATRILDYTDRACEQLADAGAVIVSHRQGDQRSGILSFDVPGVDPLMVRRHCLAANISLSYRAGRLRISPHAYNNDDDMARLCDVLARLRRLGSSTGVPPVPKDQQQ